MLRQLTSLHSVNSVALIDLPVLSRFIVVYCLAELTSLISGLPLTIGVSFLARDEVAETPISGAIWEG